MKQQKHSTQLLKMKQYELERQGTRRLSVSNVTCKVPISPMTDTANVNSFTLPTANSNDFDISIQIRLIPTFRETEVDSYFNAFECISATLHWPREIWPHLLRKGSRSLCCVVT